VPHDLRGILIWGWRSAGALRNIADMPLLPFPKSNFQPERMHIKLETGNIGAAILLHQQLSSHPSIFYRFHDFVRTVILIPGAGGRRLRRRNRL
jgi:hypothetical protein